MYIYIYMCRVIYIIYIYIYVYPPNVIHLCIYLSIYLSIYRPMHLCIHAFTHLCIYLSIYSINHGRAKRGRRFLYIHIHIYTYIIYIYIYISVCSYSCIYTIYIYICVTYMKMQANHRDPSCYDYYPEGHPAPDPTPPHPPSSGSFLYYKTYSAWYDFKILASCGGILPCMISKSSVIGRHTALHGARVFAS